MKQNLRDRGLTRKARQRRLAAGRKSIDQAEFVAIIHDRGGDSAAASAIWEHLRRWGYAPGFTPYPDDNLFDVFGIADEELDEDIVLKLIEQFGLTLPSRDAIREFGSLDSPLRVAQFIAMCRRTSLAETLR